SMDVNMGRFVVFKIKMGHFIRSKSATGSNISSNFAAVKSQQDGQPRPQQTGAAINAQRSSRNV
ncbi:hypothetical protein ACLOJK_002583, partial [Asimina triloba]